MIWRLFVGLALVLAAVAPAYGAPFAQTVSDAAVYLPTDYELPERFEHRPARDTGIVENGAVAVLRWYERRNPEVAADDITLLQLIAERSESTARASVVFDRTIRAWSESG